MSPPKPSLSRVWSSCYSLGELKLVEIQVMVRSGLPRFDIIGLPQNVIREGKDRIISSLNQLGVDTRNHRILVSLVPGDIPKEGSHFDLPILAGILKCLGAIPSPENERDFYWGEVGIDGSVRPFRDILAHLLFVHRTENARMLCPTRDEPIDFALPYLKSQPSCISNIVQLMQQSSAVQAQPSLPSAAEIDQINLSKWKSNTPPQNRWDSLVASEAQVTLWAMAAIGRLHYLLEGPPGQGKSTWSFALKELLPPLTVEGLTKRFLSQPKATEKLTSEDELFCPPFISPHHSSSAAAIVGGGSSRILSGAITKAHLGVLFLDEFGEFSRNVIESLREPLENGYISIARVSGSERLPANIQLIAAMNPCPCGNYNTKKVCQCRAPDLYRYRNRLSAAIRDRFHLNPWWTYEGQHQKSTPSLRETRERISAALTIKKVELDQISIPKKDSPRKLNRYLNLLDAWCRWSGKTIATQKDVQALDKFIQRMEDPHYEQQNANSLKRRSRAGI